MKPVARPRTQHAVIALGITQIIGWGTTFYVPAILARPIADDLGLPLLGVLGASSWALLLSGLLSRRIGALIDRHGAASILTSASLLAGCALLLHAIADSLWLIWLAWSLIGLGMRAMLYDGAFAALAALAGPGSRRAISLLTLLGGLASTVFWPISHLLLETVGWRGALAAFGAMNMLICAPLHYFFSGCQPQGTVGSADKAAAAANPHERSTTAPSPQWAEKAVLLIATAFACHAFIWSSLAVHLPELIQGIGLSAGAAVAIAAMMGPAQVISRSAELLAQRWLSPLTLTVPVFAMLPLSLLLFALPIPAGIAATAFVLTYGFSNGLLTILRGALPLMLIGSRGYGELLGRLAAPSLVVSALSPLVLGQVLESWGPTTAACLLGLAGLGCTLAAVALVRHARTSDTRG